MIRPSASVRELREAEEALNLPPFTRALIERRLFRMGLNPGPADGVFDEAPSEAPEAPADDVGHVTMLQRTPTYFRAGRNADELADTLRELEIPEEWKAPVAEALLDLEESVARAERERAEALRAQLKKQRAGAATATAAQREAEARLAAAERDFVTQLAEIEFALGDGLQLLALELVQVGDEPLVDMVGQQEHLDIVLFEDLEMRTEACRGE